MKRWVGALALAGLVACDDGGSTPAAGDMGAGGMGGTAGQGGTGGSAGQGGAGGTAGQGGSGGMAGQGGNGGMGGGGTPVEQLASRHPRARFKRTDRLRLEFARAMDLELNQICTELSFNDCFKIHGISLGGVEAYNANIYEAFENTSVAAPMIVERIATFACTRRIFIDVSDRDNSVIWGDVPLNGAQVRDIEGDEAVAAVTTLFTRSLQRRPTAAELAGAQALYREIEASEVDQPALYWAQGLCVAVLTSVESLFY